MLFILITLIFIRPFISSLAFPYLNFIYSSILLGLLVIWFICAYPQLIRKSDSEKLLYKSLKYPLLFFILSLIISVIFSSDKINSLEEIYKYITVLLIFWFSIYLSNKNKTQVIQTLILAGFIVSILAIYQYFLGFQRLMDYINKEGITDSFALDYIGRKRVYFPFVTPNTLAGYLILILPLAFILKNKVKWIIILSISLALLFTKSLGAILSLLLGAGVYLYLKNDLPKKKIFLLGIVFIFFIFIFMFIFISRQEQALEHTLPTFSMAKRLSYWYDTVKIIGSHPFVGIGIGNFNLTQTRYAHNSYLQIWAEMGLFGIIFFFWLIGNIFKFSFRNINDCRYKGVIVGHLIASIIFLVHNFIDFTFFLPEVALIWWVILGIML